WLALSVAGVLLARWLAIAPRGKRPRRFSWQVVAFAALGLGAAFHDDFLFGLAGGLLGCAAVAWWWRSLSEEKTRPRRFAALALMAALAGSLAWQTAHREVLREVLEVQILPTLGPPESDELNELLIELHGFFDGLPLESVMPPPSAEVPDSTDLAYALWRRSPLTHHDGLSAVLIEDNLGQRHIFSFGLAFGAGLEPLPSPARWPVPEVPEWRDALIQGDARLTLDGRGWGRARFWYLPRPGFRRQVNELHELERNLVRGKPRQETADGLPEGVRYALYNGIGEARSSPWDEAPPLDADVVAGAPCGQRTTPDGDSWCWAYRAADGFETLYLPVLGPQQAIERVGAMAMWLFPWLVLLGAVAFAGAVRSAGVLELWRASTRSYSRRLALVFTLLLLVPLIALNLVLLRSVAERLRTEQLADARGAMVSARTLLLDYLRGLEPGFLIETQVNRELLDWIGGLVGHQVNLYWGSRLYASSQQELFTAGLLPRRIPGEIFTRLSLYGYDLGFRRQQTGDLAYLEVYAPVDVPGIVSSQQGLFLSVPLLEQEEAAARELAAMRSRAILFSSALLLLTLAVAGRLSRRFTEPIVQLIAGTRSIARGESYDPVKPRETELMALARAIDEMAAQVAASRRGLEREKHFVERVVDSITSAVVSLDRDRRVVLHNRVAEELLGTEIGTLLGDTLGQSDHFEPVLAFLEEAGPVPLRRQVKLRPAGERVDVFEWSLTWVPIPGSEDPAALLVVDDATEVMRGQRLETWAEMARIIAHEIKNPLTPIQLSTEHMQHAYKVDPDRFDDVLSRCAGNILRNVAELRQIASEFSTYSRIPAADLQPGDLVASIQLLVANYRDAPRGTEVAFASELDRLEVRFDERLIGRAVRNLVENALRETTDGGGEVRVEVDVERGDGVSRDFSGDAPPPEWAMVRVIDSGPGVDPQKLERIFEPYFSTYESGTGLGLAITRRIVEEHGGTIEARNRPGGGLAVIIRIPRTGENARPTLEADP
ncbi:MAG: ATP-binding protein, partial [Acidobacteriota bacterium]